MLYAKTNSVTAGKGNTVKIAASVALRMGFTLVLTISGCSSYEKSSGEFWRSEYRPYSPLITGAYSPSFIFGNQQKTGTKPYYVDSQQYHRVPWPTSDQAIGYVNDSEIITYREYRYDNRYISSDNQPKNHFHSYLRGYRVGQKYR